MLIMKMPLPYSIENLLDKNYSPVGGFLAPCKQLLFT